MNQIQFQNACQLICSFIVKHKNVPNETKLNVNPQPGQLSSILDKFAFKERGRPFEDIFKHFIDVIYPNTLNWQHPLFLGYFPSCNSYPSILGELLSAGLGTIGLSWKSCPALTELEMFCLNEIIHLMQLPFASGNILSSSSESVMISMITAIHISKAERSKLVVYASELAHSCVHKSARILQLQFRKINVSKDTWQIDTNAFINQILEDIQNDLIPLYACATFGTTSLCSTDNLSIVGKICKQYNIYLHVDAAYAGTTLFCRKYRRLVKGIEYADSMNINCNKLMLVNYDCTLALYKDTTSLVDALSVDPPYLNSDFNRIDLRNYDISLSRRFRALKLWFTLHTYGITGIRRHLKRMFRRARVLAAILRKNDTRIEILNKVIFGLVCFRIKNSNSLTHLLFQNLSKNVNIYLTESCVQNLKFIRISINNITSRNQIKQISSKIIHSIDSIMGVQDLCTENATYQKLQACNLVEAKKHLNTLSSINETQNSNNFYNIVNNSVNMKIGEMLNKKRRRRSISNIVNVNSEFLRQFIEDVNTDQTW